MFYFILIATGIIIVCMIAVLAARTVLSISFRNTNLNVSLTIVGCGLGYESNGHRVSLLYGRRTLFLKSLSVKPKVKKEKQRRKAEKDQLKPKTRRKMPLAVILHVVKAGVLLVARFLSCVQYDKGQLQLQPVIVNPALAGMAFGWSQALRGTFPGLRAVFDFAPNYCTGSGQISGRAEFSIKNRQVVALLLRFLGDLPIKELIKYRFLKKR